MKSKTNKILLFLLNPFLSAIYSLLHIKEKGSLAMLYCWFLLFGIAFCAVVETMDSYRYVEKFNSTVIYNWDSYIREIKDWFSLRSDTKDVYTLTINYFVRTFSKNYHWTFLIFASVLGLFYIKSLKIFLQEKVNDKLVFFALLFLFCFSNPILNINGARFWTSAWIGVYIVLKVFVEHKNNYLLLLLLMPLIHSSSVLWAFIVLIAFFSFRFQSIWIVLFVLSSFISAVSYLDVLNDYTYLLPEIFQKQVYVYTQSEDALVQMNNEKQVSIYTKILKPLPSYFNLLLAYLLILNRNQINNNREREYLFTVLLALFSMTNFLSAIPSVGRFQHLVIPVLVLVWAQNSTYLARYKLLFYFIPIIYFYSLFQWFNYMTSVTELSLYVLPAPLTVIKYLVFI